MVLARLDEMQCIQLIELDILYGTIYVGRAVLDALYLTGCIRHIELDVVQLTHWVE